MANNVKVAGDVTSTAVSHVVVEFVPIPTQPDVIAVQVAVMDVIAIAFIPPSGSCSGG